MRDDSPPAPRFFGSGMFNFFAGAGLLLLGYLVLNGLFSNGGDFAAPLWTLILFGVPLALGLMVAAVIRVGWVMATEASNRKYDRFDED